MLLEGGKRNWINALAHKILITSEIRRYLLVDKVSICDFTLKNSILLLKNQNKKSHFKKLQISEVIAFCFYVKTKSSLNSFNKSRNSNPNNLEHSSQKDFFQEISGDLRQSFLSNITIYNLIKFLNELFFIVYQKRICSLHKSQHMFSTVN